MRRRIDSAPTDLPEPLSPTTATVSPGSTLYEPPSTARTSPAPVRNSVRKLRTSSKGGNGVPLPKTLRQTDKNSFVAPLVAAGPNSFNRHAVTCRLLGHRSPEFRHFAAV